MKKNQNSHKKTEFLKTNFFDRVQLSLKNELFLYIALAFIFSVLCRLYWVFWASEFSEFYFNDELMIISNDGYAFAEGARDMIAGFHQPNDLSYFGSSLSTLTYYLYKLTPFSFETIILYMSVFFSSLVVVPVMLIAYEYKMLKAGFLAALLASIANSYYNRTMAGYYDTDMLAIVLPCFVLYFMIRLIIKKDKFSLITLPFVMMFYLWYYPSSYTLNVAFVGLFLLYTLAFHRQERINYEALSFMLIALAPIAWFYQAAILALLFAFFNLTTRFFTLKALIWLLILSLVFLFLSGGLDPILYQLNFYIFKSAAVGSVSESFSYFNVNQTIQEVGSIDLSVFMQRIAASELAFICAVLGLILLIKDHKSFLLALPMLALGFLALRGGLRFTIYAVPVMALGFGYFVYFLVLKLAHFRLAKPIILTFALIISLGFALKHIYEYKAPSVFNANEARILDRLKSIASAEDYVLAWWDYGYPVRYYSDVKTLADGGKHLGKDNFLPSYALSFDQVSGANLARLGVEYTEKSFYDKNDSLLQADLLKAMMRDYNASEASLFLHALKYKNFKANEKTRDIYFYLPARMSPIFPTVASFSHIDLQNGQINDPFVFSTALALGKDEKTGFYYLSNGMFLSDDFTHIMLGENAYAIKAVYEFDSIKDASFKQRMIDENGNFYVFYLKESLSYPMQFIIMDKTMFDSLFVQLFFFNNYDKDLFEPVILDKDAKIYKLKR
ncbi:peptide-binding protein [Campylobacter sp. MIT 12-8780]|uniref:STT3 domain-containing protein n=1 Tax=Campylobacter sp. MIT 12-8780 TaxID=2202200 RepID=UPI00115E1C95|nr:STT3 domain-containing protein [Campylobacter sp. MIT 12-8780]TQR41043.1 peptide-binding protein [Campylobacter sp. MIT 12-8780]